MTKADEKQDSSRNYFKPDDTAGLNVTVKSRTPNNNDNNNNVQRASMRIGGPAHFGEITETRQRLSES